MSITAEAVCETPCPYTRFPVCGKNGKKYKIFGNECFFNNHNRCHKNDGKLLIINNLIKIKPKYLLF